MEQLFERLETIKNLLEQVHTITQNQMTVLLDTRYAGEGLDLVEQMASYKEQLTTEVEVNEGVFQTLYEQYKESIVAEADKKRLKTLVDDIMRYKEYIIEAEGKNVFILQDLLRRCSERVDLPKNPSHVARAYKAHEQQK